MSIRAVTTFNESGRQVYGNRMLESFRRNWPEEVSISVYAEGWSAPGTIDLFDSSPWLASFKHRHRHRRFRDYRWDAVKFAHKVAALCHAARQPDVDVLAWVDGDIVTHSPVTIDDLRAMEPRNGDWISWLDRVNLHPECGLYFLNCRHPRHREMIDAFHGSYEDDKIFGLAEWHDSFVLNHLVKVSGIGAMSLSGRGYRTSHPMVNGPLGKWFDHLKGNRKVRGHSSKGDLKVHREEAYWQ